MNHNYYMEKVLELANESIKNNDVPVGCIIVKDGQIIASSFNTREINQNSIEHAEMNAIKIANEKLNNWNLSGCTMYVNKEPCLMCSGAIVQSRITNLVIGCLSEKDGCIVSKININDLNLNHKININTGVLKEESAKLLQDFFKNLR